MRLRIKACVNVKNKDEDCFIYLIRLSKDVCNNKTLNKLERVKQWEKYITDLRFAQYKYPASLNI